MKLEQVPHVLMIGYVWPEPCSSAAGVRDWDLIRIFKKSGWKITFTSPSALNSYSEAIAAEGISTHTFVPNDPAFDTFIQQLCPDVVVFDRFVIEEQFGWRVRENCPQAMTVLDTQDLHLLRRARERALASGQSLENIFAAKIELHSDDSHRELASIYRCDLSLILSEFETNLLIEKFQIPHELLMTLGFCYPAASSNPRPFQERLDFVMIGNFRHPPNADATHWLKKEIWPLIRSQARAAEIHIYGAYPSREIMQLDSPEEGFRVIGPAENAIETLSRYRVNFAPLRFGAGIKGKIADGWSAGTPAVGTPIAQEGMTSGLEWGGLVANDPMSFAQAAVRLNSDSKLWNSCSQHGMRILREKFSFDQLQPLFLERLLKLHSELHESRKRNLIGQMLWYHLNRSTQYFSKWIELKSQIRSTNASH